MAKKKATQIFNGKRYELYRSFTSKREANNQARVLRSEGYARVNSYMQPASPPFAKHRLYFVWFRKK